MLIAYLLTQGQAIELGIGCLVLTAVGFVVLWVVLIVKAIWEDWQLGK